MNTVVAKVIFVVVVVKMNKVRMVVVVVVMIVVMVIVIVIFDAVCVMCGYVCINYALDLRLYMTWT